MDTSAKGRPWLRWLLLLVVLSAGTAIRHSYNSGTLVQNPLIGDAWFYYVYARNILENATFSK